MSRAHGRKSGDAVPRPGLKIPLSPSLLPPFFFPFLIRWSTVSTSNSAHWFLSVEQTNVSSYISAQTAKRARKFKRAIVAVRMDQLAREWITMDRDDDLALLTELLHRDTRKKDMMKNCRYFCFYIHAVTPINIRKKKSFQSLKPLLLKYVVHFVLRYFFSRLCS